MTKEIKAPAKINLFLDITGKTDNGYHRLFMIMQTVDLYDCIKVTKTAGRIITKCSDPDIPTGKKNTVHKAAELFFEYTKIKGGVKIEIEKNIPTEAGLAGGSSDAAAVLKAMNELYETNLTEQTLCELGLKVGSDVPFCLIGGTCLVQNTGGIISRLKPLDDCKIVLVKPDCNISTAKAYEEADNTYLYHPDCIKMLDSCEIGYFDNICKYAGNIFEQVVEVPERVEIKQIMRENGAVLSQMSGSGPTVFGIFKKEKDAEAAADLLKKRFDKVYITKPI